MSGYISDEERPVTTQRLVAMKNEGKKIAMLTSYDYTTARIVDEAGVDVILVGDSASNVMAGNDTTLPITVEQMIYHAQSVARAVKHALVVCDMPFGSYQVSKEEALRNAIHMMKESGCDALKLEGGKEIADTVKAIVDAGIPVMGHLGLTPQSVHKFGGYGVRARGEAEAMKLLDDATCLEEAGCFSIVLEKIPAALAAEYLDLSFSHGSPFRTILSVFFYILPPFAIECNLFHPFQLAYRHRYADLHKIMTDAIGNYVSDVRSGSFPNKDEQY